MSPWSKSPFWQRGDPDIFVSYISSIVPGHLRPRPLLPVTPTPHYVLTTSTTFSTTRFHPRPFCMVEIWESRGHTKLSFSEYLYVNRVKSEDSVSGPVSSPFFSTSTSPFPSWPFLIVLLVVSSKGNICPVLFRPSNTCLILFGPLGF